MLTDINKMTPSLLSNWIFTIVVASLLGLVIIQLALLGVGIRLEKTKLDQSAKIAIKEVKKQIGVDPELSENLVKLTVPQDDFYVTSQDSLYKSTVRKLTDMLELELEKQDVLAKFSFVISDQYEEVLMANPLFKKNDFRFDQYQILLDNEAIRRCRCLRILHLNINNLFNYLLRQLAYLFIPSLLFIALIIGGFSLLIINLDRQQQLDIIKNDFINNLTHELKTPVFSISLTIKVLNEKLMQGKLDKALQLLGLINKENEKLKTHIDKVLELASLESGKYQPELQEQDVTPIIEGVLERFHFKITNKNGVLKQDYQATNSTLRIDKTHFANVLENLLENALKYSKEQPQITISTFNENENFCLAVTDQGIGINKADQALIFDKFYRVSTGDLHTVKGFGLGLSYVKKIVEAMGGQINVESEVGKGSTFKILFLQEKGTHKVYF